MCQWLWRERGCNFVSAMPCNIFGKEDLFDGHVSHIIPGLIARMHSAKEKGVPTFDVWGRADTLREYLYSDDLARALIHVMNRYDDPEPINTGSGYELSVGALAACIQDVVGYQGELLFDGRIPAGTPRKLLDNTKLFNLGWKPQVDFRRSLEITYEWYKHAKQTGLLRTTRQNGVAVPRDEN